MNVGPHKTGRRNLAAYTGITIVAIYYFAAVFAGFLAPYDHREQTRTEPSAPPSNIRWRDSDGQFHARPFIYAQKLVDARIMRYEEDPAARYPLVLFNGGRLFGVDPGDSETPPRIRLLGTDQLGRDRFSRLMFAIRFSLFVSPVGTILACLIGVMFGAVSGYARRSVDAVMMGVADTVISLPTLILILAARAAFPLELPPFSAAVLLIAIFSVTGWAEMARLTRGLVISTKEREFVLAAKATGLDETTILWRHILPNITSPLLIQATLMLPAFLLAEIALSFLGVGLQEPEPSLGNMLSLSGDLSALSASPLVMLSPAIAIFLFVFGVRLAGYKAKRTAGLS